MKVRKIVLVFDRNPNIRNFLKRELSREGFKVRLVKTSEEVLKYIYWPIPADVLILDSDGIHRPLWKYIEEIDLRSPEIPILIHGINVAMLQGYVNRENIFFVEKDSDSVATLTNVLNQIIFKT